MSSYNFLRAVGDGLAEAIRYRTNLKRERRENEYNYNRDLGRKRDELDYMTEYNWKQQQRAHDRDIEWANQKREADKARILDFVDTYNPANVNRHDWADVQNFNTNAIANDIPLSIKYENLENLNKSLQDKMAVLKQQHDYRMAEIAANRMGRGGSVRQPSLTPYEKLQRDLSMAKTPEEREMVLQLHRVGSRAVKGGSGKGAVMDKAGNPYIDSRFNTLQKQIIDIDEQITKYKNENAPDISAYNEKLNGILNNKDLSDKEKKNLITELNNSVNKQLEIFNKTLNDLENRKNELMSNYKNGINFDYSDYTASGTQVLHIPTMQMQQTNELNNDLQMISGLKNKLIGGNNVVNSTNNVPNQPVIIQDSTGIPLSVNPRVFKPLPQNSWQFK